MPSTLQMYALEFLRRGAKPKVTPPPAKPLPRGQALLILALMNAGRSMTVSEAAAAMGCSVPESSRRIKATEVSGHIVCKIVGRRKFASLPEMRMSEWSELAQRAHDVLR